MSRNTSLQIAAAGTAPLSPEQKRFNTLTKQIEQARATLQDWQQQIPLYQQAHHALLGPLFESLDKARREWVSAIDKQLDQPGWTQPEQRLLRELLCDVVGDLLEDQDEPDLALKDLFDRHSEVDYDTEQQNVRRAMKGMVEAMTGMDLGDEDEHIESDEALLQRMHQQMQAEDERHQAEAEARAQAKAGRRKTAAEKRREDEEKQATQSVREVYRKLASALHPDREPDPQQRAEKNALMQQVNQAYEANDLLSLLSLQLKIEQVDAEHLAQASAVQLKRYNKVLAEQLAELKSEINETVEHFCMAAGLHDNWGLKPAKLMPLLKEQSRELQAMLASIHRELILLRDKGDTKRWLKLVKRQQKEMDGSGFF